MADYSDPSYVKQMVHVTSLLKLKKKKVLYLTGAELRSSILSVHIIYTLGICIPVDTRKGK